MSSRTERPERHLAAVWFADLVGYSALASRDERAALRLVELLQATAREQVELSRGRVVKFLGDGVFAEFNSTETAVRAALALQREFTLRSAEAGVTGMLRIGVHVGDVASGPDGDLYGDGVNLAARLEAQAEPGEVLVSESVWQQLRPRSDFRFQPLGERDLKGMMGRVPVFEAHLADEEVRPAAPHGRATPARDEESRTGPHPRRSLGLALAALVLLALAAGGWLAWRRAAPRGAGLEAPAPASVASAYAASVAVLPFDNLGGGTDDEYFSEGITDEIISELAKVEGLKVISRTSVVALKGARLTLPQIADTLGVRHVLEGSVRRAGDRVRVSTQLIDPRTDTHLWGETFDRELTDIFRVQEEIARQVSSALLSRVDGLRTRGTGSRTQETAVYDAYLRGTFARQRHSREGLLTAKAAFEEAIASDSSYAPAYAGLASVYVLWALFAYPGDPQPYTAVARALTLADRAVALDSTLAEAYMARAHARLRAWMPAETVLSDLERAMRLAPNAAEVRLLHGVALAFAGRFDQAVSETGVAVMLDPLSPGHHDFSAMSLVLTTRYEEAIQTARIAQALEPRFLNPRRQEARALLLLGRYDACAAVDVGPYLALRAMCRHSAGAVAEARVIIESLSAAVDAGAPNLPLHPGAIAGDIAEYHAWIGDLDGTVHWLTRSAELSPINQFLVTETGTYDRVRRDPRFRTRLERIRREIRARVEAAER